MKDLLNEKIGNTKSKLLNIDVSNFLEQTTKEKNYE